jgi:hypothetical protein
VCDELEEQSPVLVELAEEPRELRARHRLDGFVLDRLANRDPDAGGGAVAQYALLDGICEEGPDDGDVVADRRRRERARGNVRVRLRGEPGDQRLDVARLDLGQAQSAFEVEVGDEPCLEHLAIPGPRRAADALGRPAAVVLDPLPRVGTERLARPVSVLAALDVGLSVALESPRFRLRARCAPALLAALAVAVDVGPAAAVDARDVRLFGPRRAHLDLVVVRR